MGYQTSTFAILSSQSTLISPIITTKTTSPPSHPISLLFTPSNPTQDS